MTVFSRAGLAACLMALLGSPVGAQEASPRRVSLEDAIRGALPASEAVELARTAVTRARGEATRARSTYYPQFSTSLGYNRLLRSQFEGFDFGGEPGDSGNGQDFSDLPFGRANTYSATLSFSQTLFNAAWVMGLEQSARAAERGALHGVTTAEAQTTLDVVTAYYDAVLAGQQHQIAESALAQAESTLALTEARHAAGTQPEFDVLRARVARNNQRTAVIGRATERDLALDRLKQLAGLPLDDPLLLTTPLADTVTAGDATMARLLTSDPDTSVARRVAIQQAEAAVTAQRGLVGVNRAQRLPSLVLSSQYGLVGYPENFNPGAADYLTNWNLALGIQFPLFTGGRIRGDEMVAQAGLREAEVRLRQGVKAAVLEVRSALANLDAAEAEWRSSGGTVEEAARAYRIAEIRFDEGLSTQTELLDARLALETARSVRAQAARTMQVARVRLALLPLLPLSAGSSVSVSQAIAAAGAGIPRQPTATGAPALPGTGTIP